MEQFFKNLGLNPKEIRAFLKLFEIGAQPVSILAKHLDLPRSSTYSLLDGLKRQKLIREFDRFGVKYVQALDPTELEGLLEIQEQSLKNQKTLLQRISPELEKLQSELSLSAKINFYEGAREVFQMYEASLKKKLFCAYFNAEMVEVHSPIYAFKIPEIIEKEKIESRELVVQNDSGRDYAQKYNSKTHQIKFLPKDFYFESDTIITEDVVYMIAYGHSEISGVEITQKSLAETQRVLFENLWEQAA